MAGKPTAMKRARPSGLLPGILLLAALLPWRPAEAQTEIPVHFESPSGPAAQELRRRILLDLQLQPAPLAQAQLIWMLGLPSEEPRWRAIRSRVEQGAGLVVVVSEAPKGLSALGLRSLGPMQGPISVEPTPSAGDFLGQEVVWSSAPQAFRATVLQPTGGAFEPLLSASGRGPLLFAGRLGQGRVLVLGLDLLHPQNREFTLWPYFNYFCHVQSRLAIGGSPDRFADWPAAPLPGSRTLVLLLAGLGSLWLLTLGLFWRARRHSRQHPEILNDFFSGAATGRPDAMAGSESGGWAGVGFSRPLAGFLTLTSALFLLFAPFYYVTNILIPNHIQPFPQAKGIWDFAWEALQIAWFLFDAGTFVAFVKYFAEFRIKDPREAVRSAQFFVWWQILTGLVQVSLACLTAVLILPHTRYGFSSNFVILIALSQYPGCFGVVTFFFQAYQRFDINIGLDLLSDWLLRFALMIPCVLIFRAWGVQNPIYGEAFGAAIGIGVGYYLSTLSTFFIGVLLYRRLGLRLLPLFLCHFNGATAKRMLAYGIKVVAGQAMFRAAKTVDRVVISLLLLNYTEWLGIEGQIHYNLMFLFPVAYRFFETAMAALSESHGNGKPALTQYYLVRFFQMGSLYTAIGLSLLWALGPMFVSEAMDPQWARAADYIVIAAVIGAFYSPAWISDMLQKGAGRPELFAMVLGVEQVLRIGLFFLLIPRFQFMGFYLALLFTILLKVVGAWIINHRVIVRLRLYPYSMFIAPALAGGLNFLLLRLLAGLLGLHGRITMILFFFGAALLSFFLCFFLCGFLGGIDQALAREMDRAWRMTGPLRPLARLFVGAARAGIALCPLPRPFPAALHEQAMKEAQELEQSAPETLTAWTAQAESPVQERKHD